MRKLIPQVRRYLGLDLPVRRLDLNFELAPPNRRGGKAPASDRELALSLKPLEKRPDKQLDILLKQVQTQNRQEMAPGKRMARNTIVLRWFHPIAVQCIHRFSKNGGIPDDPERQQILDLVSATARSLATSYKAVFQDDYDSSRFHYARHRDRIHLCAFRILELIRLEQRSRGLRYQALPPRAWKDANTLFHLMLAYENVEFPMPLLDGQHRGKQVSRAGNLLDLYAAIQAFTLLDYSTWPVEQQAFIDTYRKSVDKAITVYEDTGGNLGQNLHIAYCYQDRPLYPQRVKHITDPAVIVNCSILAQSIKKDYTDLMRAKAQNNQFLVPQTLASLKDAYRLAIGDLMYRNIQQEIWVGDLDQVGVPMREFRVYVGFKEIYRHLRGVFSNDAKYLQKRKLADTLAKRSAKFGEDDTATRESLWHVLYQDKRRIRLKTQETRFSTRMGVGSLVAYGAREADFRRPRLGSISRIFRPQAGIVVIEMNLLASYMEPVRIAKQLNNNALAKAGVAPQVIVAFLVHDRDNGWGLLLPKQNLIWEQTPVKIQREKQALGFELGRVRNLSDRFTLFSLPLEVTGLGSPKYPADSPKESASDADKPRLPTILDFPTS